MIAVKLKQPNNMDKKINKLAKAAAGILGEDADYIIIAHKDGQCGGITHGRTEYVAQALFALLHQNNTQLAKTVYRIIKMNTLNILANPSPFAVDLSDAISNLNLTPEQDGE